MAEKVAIGNAELWHGYCLDVLRTLSDCSVDSIVTDPPYGLKFMGKRWDYDVPSVEVWRECLRVLKPGGHLLAFAGTRTQHRMACRIEDGGFEIRDMIAWVYSTGFPKSADFAGYRDDDGVRQTKPKFVGHPQSDGWGTALKPALEPITVARKPLAGSTVAENVLAHGTGALNIDGCRVGISADDDIHAKNPNTKGGFGHAGASVYGDSAGAPAYDPSAGRWPANLIHDGSDEVVACFPDSNGSGAARTLKRGQRADGEGWGMADAAGELRDAGTGSAARFFYCSKASRADREDGVQHRDKKPLLWSSGSQNPGSFQSPNTDRSASNHHPTVKPTDLMRYLVRLVTRPGGVVLDPFMGSGSTGRAALLEGMEFVGIEREAEYVEIARARISAVAPPFTQAVA